MEEKLSGIEVEAHVKAVATSLGKALKRNGHPVPRSVLLHSLAWALGKRDWHRLKAALAEPSKNQAPAAAPSVEAAIQATDAEVVRWLGLAKLYGTLCSPMPSQPDCLVRQAARTVCPASLSGSMSWGGWSLPADLLARTMSIDAGDFTPELPAEKGLFRLELPGTKARVALEVEYTGTGWRVTQAGCEALDAALKAHPALSAQRTAAHQRDVVIGTLPHTEGTAFQVTEDDIENVLREYSLRVTDTQGKSFETMAAELLGKIDCARVEKAALDGATTLEAQAQIAFDEIKDILVELGVLEF